MNDTDSEARSIFLKWFEKDSPSAQQAWLEQACAGDEQLKARVDELLDGHRRAGDFLGGTATMHAGAQMFDPGAQSGDQIGPYKLLQQIGEGGFGVVYMAEQKQPIRRKVALKVVKAGMDSKEVLARFEAERQALAMMNHPNIAQVLDGGTTEAGRPYFVMELVQGVSVTEFCDKNRMSTRDRVELFVSVCRAIQHAHLKGVIHRDLKPSNVLVTLNDGLPRAKVIDFGVAKAIHQELTEKTLFTAYGQMVGTPQYMSPEQAEMSEVGVDTRSDIYSLGVLLYELLTGTPPLDASRLRKSGYAEIQRLIVEEEPPKPSARLSTLGEELTVVARKRDSEPPRLHSIVRGELDWVVMKALEKDRNRRYETASAFAEDLERYLRDDSVEACPPTYSYRIGKFVRRNKMLVSSVSLILVSLLLGLIGTGWMAYVSNQNFAAAMTQEAAAKAAMNRVQEELRLKAFIHATSGNIAETEAAIDDAQLVDAPTNPGWAERMRGIAAKFSDRPKLAIKHLKRAIELGDDTVATNALLTKTLWDIHEGGGYWFDRVQSMTPETLQDEMFLAYLPVNTPQENYDVANRVLEEYRLPAALEIRSLASEWLAMETGDIEWAEAGIKDAHAAWRSAGRKGAPWHAIQGHLAALAIAQRNQNEEAIKRHTYLGTLVAEQLKNTPNYELGYGAAGAADFYSSIGEEAKAREAYQLLAKNTSGGKRKYAAYLFVRGEDEETLQVLDQMQTDPYGVTVTMGARIYAESKDKRKLAESMLVKHLNECPEYKKVRLLGALYELGFAEAARREAKRLDAAWNLDKEDYRDPVVKLFAGLLNAEDVIRRAEEDPKSIWFTTEPVPYMYFRLAQWSLGNRDPKAARSYMELWAKCHSDEGYPWATRIESLLQKDPSWPSWANSQ